MTDRQDPPLAGTEAETLLGFLDYYRDTIRLKCEGLDQAQLSTPLPPTDMTLGGLVKHLALVEESWFDETFLGGVLGEPWSSVDWDADPDWEWRTAKQDTPESLLALFDRATSRGDQVIAETLAGDGLDALSVVTSRRRPDEHFSLRWILVHLIEEYARHAGHADLLRQAVDGSVGD